MTRPQTPLKIDLLRGSEISRFRIALGLLFFFVAAGWISYKVVSGQLLVLFDAALFIIFILNAAFQLVEGAGLSAAALLGKAYIIIDENRILVKPGIKAAEQQIIWNDVTRICLDNEMPEFWHAQHTNSYRLDLSKLSSEMRSTTRRTLKALAKEKNIPLK